MKQLDDDEWVRVKLYTWSQKMDALIPDTQEYKAHAISGSRL